MLIRHLHVTWTTHELTNAAKRWDWNFISVLHVSSEQSVYKMLTKQLLLHSVSALVEEILSEDFPLQVATVLKRVLEELIKAADVDLTYRIINKSALLSHLQHMD